MFYGRESEIVQYELFTHCATDVGHAANGPRNINLQYWRNEANSVRKSAAIQFMRGGSMPESPPISMICAQIFGIYGMSGLWVFKTRVHTTRTTVVSSSALSYYLNRCTVFCNQNSKCPVYGFPTSLVYNSGRLLRNAAMRRPFFATAQLSVIFCEHDLFLRTKCQGKECCCST